MEEELRKRVEVSQAALIVVDVQNDFCHPQGALAELGLDVRGAEEMAQNLVRFIERGRAVDLPIIYIKTTHDSWTDSPAWSRRSRGKSSQVCRTDSWGAEFYRLAPKEGERVVIKHRYSAFIDTELDLILRSRQLKSLLLSGISTNVCVESTARDAFMKDYQLVLLEDCLACPYEGMQQTTLDTMARYFDALVVNSSRVIAAWEK